MRHWENAEEGKTNSLQAGGGQTAALRTALDGTNSKCFLNFLFLKNIPKRKNNLSYTEATWNESLTGAQLCPHLYMSSLQGCLTLGEWGRGSGHPRWPAKALDRKPWQLSIGASVEREPLEERSLWSGLSSRRVNLSDKNYPGHNRLGAVANPEVQPGGGKGTVHKGGGDFSVSGAFWEWFKWAISYQQKSSTEDSNCPFFENEKSQKVFKLRSHLSGFEF